MAHELEALANGQTAFASARLDAWHQLGTITAECMTADEVMKAAWLGAWNVRKIPLFGHELTDDGVTRIECPDKFMTVRTNPVTAKTEYLGIVGDDYRVVQNEQCAELLDLLVDASGAHFETAGSMRGGRSVFVTMKLPQEMKVGGCDRMDLYLACTTTHDGTGALRVDATPVRIVCANTQRAAFSQTKGTYRFTHTGDTKGKIGEARAALGLMWQHFAEFETAAERMINETLTMGEFEKVCAELWPLATDATPATTNNHLKRSATLRWLVRDADTQAPIKGTRWAGYQAITEYLDHYAPASSAATRATKTLSGTGAGIKTRAFDLLTV